MTYLKEKCVKEEGDKNDVEKYLGESCEDVESENFDILCWWKVNSNKYKVLSRIAKDVLAVPMLTVASKSVFSTSERILNPFKSSFLMNLSPNGQTKLTSLNKRLTRHHANKIKAH